jgi:hypothetical protein
MARPPKKNAIPAIPNNSPETPRRKAFQVDFVESFIVGEKTAGHNKVERNC